GQAKLGAARVALIGCGATGSVMASLLVRAGVGHFRIVDRDYVEPSNLHRQLLFDEADAAQSLPKAAAAAQKLAAINSAVTVEPCIADLIPGNAAELIGDAQFVLDGTDNFETRYLINDFAVQQGIPWIYAAAVGSYAATMNILPGQTACLSCIFPDPPQGHLETCDTAGILNSAAAFVAAIAASEAIKVLLGSQQVRRTLLSYDLWSGRHSELHVSRAPDCRACAARNFIHLSGRRAPVTLCGRNSVQVHERAGEIDFHELETRLSGQGNVRHNNFVLKFWREPYEITLFRDGRAIIKGTTDHGVARSLYARYIGC
ncbi:MAG TPA: ThiF family adenylyltransferase, partial [Terriglobales bacterium]|nr:ThiF family adenylyltransferase [Terriglobales bacterium]